MATGPFPGITPNESICGHHASDQDTIGFYRLHAERRTGRGKTASGAVYGRDPLLKKFDRPLKDQLGR